MPDINKPMDIPELNLQPPITGKVKLSPDMQQTLALLCAMGVSKRIVIRASESGALLTTEPAIKDIVVVTSNAGNGKGQGDNIPCGSVLVMAHPDNDDRSWVRPNSPVDARHRWPLDKKEVVGFSVSNVNQIYFLCDTPGQEIIIAYTR